ncbi:MAG: hypothetical protein HY814_09595 [Candidatus Riflebacteria bacterium]|nr:hypothetical protein [Candidatus Riflebacteria bacterium]
MTWAFVPLEQQIDEGFGSVADAFKEAADRLAEKLSPGHSLFLEHLPVNYLYRHAMELYLKSLVLLLHKSFSIPFADADNPGEPLLSKGKSLVAVRKTHSIKLLYDHVRRLFVEYRDAIELRSRTDWWTELPNLDIVVAQVHQADAASMLFRYPMSGDVTGDSKKQGLQPVSTSELPGRLQKSKRRRVVSVTLDGQGAITAAYEVFPEPLRAATEALVVGAELLSLMCFGLRVELEAGSAAGGRGTGQRDRA